MTAPLALEGKVVAIIGRGSDSDRALAVACAEAGATIALATQSPAPEQDFAMNSIANEVWVIGRDHFVRAMDGSDPAAVAAFADETWDRFRRCDILICAHEAMTTAPLDELSADEWEPSLRTNLTGPFLAAQAFGRLMERQGGGQVILLARDTAGADAAFEAAIAGLAGVANAVNRAWGAAGVRAHPLPPGPPGDAGAPIRQAIAGP
ncbi:MAG: SDR family oxidoreductase [Chloroflexi bacterium]|nr:SDR family oxidoreductase [Chloroflexota bacterium]